MTTKRAGRRPDAGASGPRIPLVPARLQSVTAFGLVGVAGMCIDLGVFNLLRLGLMGPTSLMGKPLTASVISATLAILFNWLGGRYWAFRGERRPDVLRELAEYVAVALLGLGVSLLALAFSHYSLGFTSLYADNVAKNVVGLGLGTILRFLLLRFWVWGAGRCDAAARRDLPVVSSPTSEPEAS